MTPRDAALLQADLASMSAKNLARLMFRHRHNPDSFAMLRAEADARELRGGNSTDLPLEWAGRLCDPVISSDEGNLPLPGEQTSMIDISNFAEVAEQQRYLAEHPPKPTKELERNWDAASDQRLDRYLPSVWSFVAAVAEHLAVFAHYRLLQSERVHPGRRLTTAERADAQRALDELATREAPELVARASRIPARVWLEISHSWLLQGTWTPVPQVLLDLGEPTSRGIVAVLHDYGLHSGRLDGSVPSCGQLEAHCPLDTFRWPPGEWVEVEVLTAYAGTLRRRKQLASPIAHAWLELRAASADIRHPDDDKRALARGSKAR